MDYGGKRGKTGPCWRLPQRRPSQRDVKTSYLFDTAATKTYGTRVIGDICLLATMLQYATSESMERKSAVWRVDASYLEGV